MPALAARNAYRLAGAGFCRICAAVFLTAPSSAWADAQHVDLKLVLATDVSPSIDQNELRLEREGTADAFLDPEVIDAIGSGSLGRIAVTAIDFSNPQDSKVTVGWQIIKDRASAVKFAEAVRNAPRTLGRLTSVSGALELGTLLLETSDRSIAATRRVIDVSGDGPNNYGTSMTQAHDRAIADGVVVNGLPVMDEQANGYFAGLDKYYAACVAGGKGSFVIVVRSYKDFTAAMRRKLILEISQSEPNVKAAKSGLGKNRILLRTAAPSHSAWTPEVLRPGPNEFSHQCDIQGGFSSSSRF